MLSHSLFELLLGQNPWLSGSLPSEMSRLSLLDVLDLSKTSLEGPIDAVYDLEALTELQLAGCGFSGTLGTELGCLRDLAHLDLSWNNFSGSIPEELSQLKELVVFRVNGNAGLTGSIPESYCNQIYVGSGLLFGNSVVADCTPSAQTGVAPMECSCCSECCDPETKICFPTR